MLFHLGYTSTESRPLSSNDLLALLESIRAANERMQLTGLLLYRENSFFQVLEGEEDVVRGVFERIKRDTRHHRVELLFEGPIEKREFTDWSMGFVQLDGIDVTQLPGYSHFLEDGQGTWQMFHEMSKTQRLMTMFRDIA